MPSESTTQGNTERAIGSMRGGAGGRRLWCREEGSSDGGRAAVCVRMKSVLDSETVDGWAMDGWRMDGWAMDGEWMDGMVSGREAEGKKKTDQGWGNRT